MDSGIAARIVRFRCGSRDCNVNNKISVDFGRGLGFQCGFRDSGVNSSDTV